MTLSNTRSSYLAVLVIAAAGILLAGCAPNKAPPPATPPVASPQRVQEIRNAYWRAYPDSRVGVIDVVDHTHKLASVSQVNGGDFRDGEMVVIIDEKQKVIANGTIVRILPDHIHVAYDKANGAREPVAGDMMIRIPPGGTTL